MRKWFSLKKIISSFSIASIIIFSSTQIVSCTVGIGDDSDEHGTPEDIDQNYDQLLKEMHIEINNLIQSVFKNNIQKLITTPETTDSKYKFLSIANIKNILNEQDNVIIDLDDPALIDKKDDLLYDLDLMYSNANINNLITKFADENEEYGIFLKYVDNYFRTFVIDEGLVEFSKGTIDVSNWDTQSYYQVKFTVRVEYVFNNLDQELDSYESQNYQIVFSYFESQEGFESLFLAFVENLPKNLFNNDVFKFDKEILNVKKDYSNIDDEINNFLLTNDDFHNSLVSEIQNIAYEEILLDLDVNLSNLRVDSITVSEDYSDQTNWSENSLYIDLYSSEFINEFVFNPSHLSNYEKTELFHKESQDIFNDKWFSDLLNSLLESYGKDLTNSEEIEKWLRVIKFGQFSLSGIEIDFHQGQYFTIPTLFFDYTYEVLGDIDQTRVYLYEEQIVKVLSNFQKVLKVKRTLASYIFDMQVFYNSNGENMFVDKFQEADGEIQSNNSGISNNSIFDFDENDEIVKKILEGTEITNLSFYMWYSPWEKSARINNQGIFVLDLYETQPYNFEFTFLINDIEIIVISNEIKPSYNVPFFSFYRDGDNK